MGLHGKGRVLFALEQQAAGSVVALLLAALPGEALPCPRVLLSHLGSVRNAAFPKPREHPHHPERPSRSTGTPSASLHPLAPPLPAPTPSELTPNSPLPHSTPATLASSLFLTPGPLHGLFLPGVLFPTHLPGSFSLLWTGSFICFAVSAAPTTRPGAWLVLRAHLWNEWMDG